MNVVLGLLLGFVDWELKCFEVNAGGHKNLRLGMFIFSWSIFLVKKIKRYFP